jgi:PBP1b-binding outer membrane lipoprotein LpoB
MKNIKFAVIFALVLSGCATSRATIDTYIDPNFSAGDVKDIAVFPLRNARLAPSEALQINREIIQAINRGNPALRIIGASEAVDVLNDKGLAEQWAKFLENYATSGIPDAGILREVGTALNVDKILQGELVNVFQRDGNGWDTLGTTRVTVHYAMMDVATNKTVWDATSDGIAQKDSLDAPPIIDAIRLAQNKILEALPF